MDALPTSGVLCGSPTGGSEDAGGIRLCSEGCC